MVHCALIYLGELKQIARWNGGSYLNYTYLKGESNSTVFPGMLSSMY